MKYQPAMYEQSIGHTVAVPQLSTRQTKVAQVRASHPLLQLQNMYGNRYVQQVVGDSSPAPTSAPIIQTKLVLGPVDDPYEREADQVARQATGQISRDSSSPTPAPTPLIRRMSTQLGAGVGAVDTSVQKGIQSARGGGHSLPDSVRTNMEQSLGADFSNVRVHTGARADQLNQSLQARAFTTGSDIFFRRGEYNPSGQSGQQILAHELTHVVQQNGAGAQRSSPSQAAATIQRLLYDEVASKLYVPPTWNDESEEITLVSPNLHPVDQVKSVGEYRRDPNFVRQMATHWEISPVTTIQDLHFENKESWKMEPFAQKILETSRGPLLTQAQPLFKPGTSRKEVGAAIVLITSDKKSAVNRDQLLDGHTVDDLERIVNASKAGTNRRIEQVLADYINPFYILYQMEDAADILDGAKLRRRSKPIINPVNFMEANEGSAVEEFHRDKVCVLLAEVYERIYGTQDRNQVWARLQQLAQAHHVQWDKFIISEQEFADPARISQQSGKKTRDKIYEMVESLHNSIRVQDNWAYDLTKNVESIRSQGGYKLLLSGKFAWRELPQHLPENVQMSATEVIIVGIEGHTQAVRIKQDIQRDTVIDDPADFFQPLNETKENYNKGVFTQRVIDVYVRK